MYIAVVPHLVQSEHTEPTILRHNVDSRTYKVSTTCVAADILDSACNVHFQFPVSQSCNMLVPKRLAVYICL